MDENPLTEALHERHMDDLDDNDDAHIGLQSNDRAIVDGSSRGYDCKHPHLGHNMLNRNDGAEKWFWSIIPMCP